LFAFLFFFQAEDGIRDFHVTGVQTCALPISQQLYQEARAAMRAKNNEQALELLETLQARYPFGDHALQAQLDIIYMYFKNDEWRSEERRVGKECRSRWEPHH